MSRLASLIMQRGAQKYHGIKQKERYGEAVSPEHEDAKLVKDIRINALCVELHKTQAAGQLQAEDPTAQSSDIQC